VGIFFDAFLEYFAQAHSQCDIGAKNKVSDGFLGSTARGGHVKVVVAFERFRREAVIGNTAAVPVVQNRIDRVPGLLVSG
jgi:hypothetical protein